MDNKIKRYLDRVVMELMGSTKIDFEKKKIDYPFLSSPLFSSSLSHFLSHPSFSSLRFFDYCKDKYGLTEKEEDYVWKEYRNIIKDKIEEYRSNILDKIKTGPNKIKRYLDRVVIELVSATKIDYEKEIVFPLFLISRTNPLIDSSNYHFRPSDHYRPFVFGSDTPLFYEYCKKTFGLTDDEVYYVWTEYKDIITDKIKTGRSLPS